MLRSILFATFHMLLIFHESQCITCTFTFVYSNVINRTYGCQLHNQIIESENDWAVIDGSHEIGYTDQHVTWISSHNSRISFVPTFLFIHFPNVKRGIFDESQMTSLGQPISCSELEELSLSGNLLSNIPDGFFANCSHLKVLTLSGNNLQSIGELTFSGLTDLQSLYLQRNNLSSIHPKSFELLVDLSGINLASNQLETLDPNLFLNCRKLQNIFINDNRITTLSDDFLVNNWQLFQVDLSHNRINSIGPKLFGCGFTISGYFILSYNLIDELPIFDYVFGLRYLYLNNNKIRKTLPDTFKNLSDLFLLRLDNNQIDDLQAETFGTYSSVRYVYLNSNNISVLPENSFSRTLINELWLSDNQLSHLNASSFAQMSNLFVLHVERNRIEKVDRRIFDEAPLLGTLNLTGNVCADESFSRGYDLTWPRIGTCSSVKVQANVIALVIVLLIKMVI